MSTGPWVYDLGLSTGTGPWTYDLQLSTPLATQTAIARISAPTTKTQSATANISAWSIINTIAANSTSYNDYAVVHGVTYQYRVAPITGGIVGTYIYSGNITYSGGTITSKTQWCMARIAVISSAGNNMMMGSSF